MGLHRLIHPLKWGLLAALAVSCGCESFDNDEGFRPRRTQALFLLPTSGAIYQLSSTTQQAEPWPGSAVTGPASAFTLLTDRAWVAPAATPLALELTTGGQERSRHSLPGTAVAAAAGTDYVLMAVASPPRLAFIGVTNRADGSPTLTPDYTPRHVLYSSSEKFYVASDSLVEVWSERALTPLRRNPMPGRVLGLHLNSNRAVVVQLLTATGLAEVAIDPNSNEAGAPAVVSYQAAAYTPFFRQQFATELTQPVFINATGELRLGSASGSRLAPPDTASRLLPDFQSSQVFYMSGTELRSTAPPYSSAVSHGMLPAQARQALFFYTSP